MISTKSRTRQRPRLQGRAVATARPRGPTAVGLALLLGLALASGPARAVSPTANQEQKKKEKKEEVAVEKKQEAPERIWSIDGILETHFIVVRDNYYANDAYHILYLRGNVDVPAFWRLPAIGRISLRMDVTRRYVADPQESGFLFGDMLLYWSRAFPFHLGEQEFNLRTYFIWSFPTSRLARREGNIARPLVLLALSKQLPAGFMFFLRPFARLNWHRYAEMEGGAPNMRWELGYDTQLIYTFPWHKPLSLGGTWGQEWFNKYASRDGADQPWNSEYYWEVFTGYQIFEKPVSLSTYLVLTSGRKTFEDGVWRFHWIDRDETEIYLSISATY